MKKTFDENRARLGANERERLWNRVAGRTARSAVGSEDRSDPVRPSRSVRDGRSWRLWGPVAVGAAASVVLVVALWERGPSELELRRASGDIPYAAETDGESALGGVETQSDEVAVSGGVARADAPAVDGIESAPFTKDLSADGGEVAPAGSAPAGSASVADAPVEAVAPAPKRAPEPVEAMASVTEDATPSGPGPRDLAESTGDPEVQSTAPSQSAGPGPSRQRGKATASTQGDERTSSAEAPAQAVLGSSPKAAGETAERTAPTAARKAGALREDASVTPDSLETLRLLADAQPGEIVGRVVDQNGDPVPYANVVVLRTQWGAMSGDDGVFRIRNLPDGTYSVRAQVIGYTDDEVDSVIVGERPVALAFRVEETILGSLNEVEVSASNDRPGPASTGTGEISGRDLDQLPVGETSEAIGLRAGVIERGTRVQVPRGTSEVTAKSDAGTAGAATTYGSLESLSRRSHEAERADDIVVPSPSSRPDAANRGDGDTAPKEPPPARPRMQDFGMSKDEEEERREPVPPATPYDAVYYRDYGSNPLVSTDRDALSTFAVDVDKGAYTVARRYLTDGYLPEPASVRVEEFVNYFGPGYAEFDDTDFRIYADGAPSPFRRGYELLRVGLQARTVDDAKRPSARLTFVVDVSGSMSRENRLGLVRRSLGMLLDQLRRDDEVAVVAYGSTARVILGPTEAGNRDRIRWAIEQLQSGGSTNAEDGLRLGYDLAREMYLPEGINRILLCSDGVANVGRTGPESILRTARAESDRGIYLTTIGFGMGNYNDVLMEQLADQGDGAYYYVDRYEEAERVLVRELTGTLLVVARDAKVQVEFDRDMVEAYRLIGFENRDVADRDFRNDTIDAGEIGSGHSVVALYEVRLRDRIERGRGRKDLATVRLRYALPERGTDRDPEVREISRRVTDADLTPSWGRAPWRFRLAGVVAQYAEILRNSYWAQDDRIAELVPLAADLAFHLRDDDEVVEFSRIVEKAAELQDAMTAQQWEARWPRLEARVPDYPDRRTWGR